MTKAEIRERFASVVALADKDIRLDEAALLIAAKFDVDFNIARYLKRLDKLAKRFETAYDDSISLGISVSSLNDFIHRE